MPLYAVVALRGTDWQTSPSVPSDGRSVADRLRLQP
jgi:hypothetical protein